MKYYSLESGYKKDALQLRFINLKSIDPIKLLIGKKVEIENLKFEYAFGKKEYDLILCGFTSLFLISEEFVKVLVENSLKGYLITKIHINSLELKKSYYLLSITGRSGPILNELSYQSSFNSNIPGLKESIVWKGLFFNPDTHDGSDLFIPEGSQLVFLTEYAARKMVEANLENIRLIDSKEMINLSVASSPQSPDCAG